MKITKREMIAGISIVAIMFLIGVVISREISDAQLEKNEIYDTALKIDSQDLFEYGMRTSVGNSFVYGTLKAVESVGYPEIFGEYAYIRKVKEEYTKHERQVEHTRTVNGKTETYYTTEEYWTWDYVGSESKHVKQWSFLNNVFDYDKIKPPDTELIDTVKKSSHIRYKYYGVKTEYVGTLFTDMRNGTISRDSSFYVDMTIEETVNHLENDFPLTEFFWIAWIALIGVCVLSFCAAENTWLE